ncbi:MAG: 50S ribosomal protein L44e [archaeon]
MKIKKNVNRYCPHCKKRTKQTIEEIKKRKASEMRQGQRRFRRVTAGYRGFPRPKPDTGKQTRRRNLGYTCTVCKKISQRSFPRVKKFEIVRD